MKILLVSDFGLQHTVGGAQRSNQMIVDAGRLRGHHIDFFHYDTTQLYDNYDILISSNLEVISQRIPLLLEHIRTTGRHVRLEHDSNLYWNNDYRRTFWGSCRLSFFLTQYHVDYFKIKYGDIFQNIRIVPDPISADFTNLGLPRFGIGAAGFTHSLKGTDVFIKYVRDNQDKQFYYAGWGSEYYIHELNNLPNLKMMGQLDHNEMINFYNSIEEFVHFSQQPEPFCRSVGEAILCGVPKITCPDNIGSYLAWQQDKDGFAKSCHDAANNFWSIIENDFNPLSN